MPYVFSEGRHRGERHAVDIFSDFPDVPECRVCMNCLEGPHERQEGVCVAQRLSCRLPDDVERRIINQIGAVIAAGKGAKSRALRYLVRLAMDNSDVVAPDLANAGKMCVIEVDEQLHTELTSKYMRKKEIINLVDGFHYAVRAGLSIHDRIIADQSFGRFKISPRSKACLEKFEIGTQQN